MHDVIEKLYMTMLLASFMSKIIVTDIIVTITDGPCIHTVSMHADTAILLFWSNHHRYLKMVTLLYTNQVNKRPIGYSYIATHAEYE